MNPATAPATRRLREGQAPDDGAASGKQEINPEIFEFSFRVVGDDGGNSLYRFTLAHVVVTGDAAAAA